MTSLFEIFHLGIEGVTSCLSVSPLVDLTQRTGLMLRPGLLGALHRAQVWLQLCCSRNIYSVGGAVGLS